MPQSVSMVEMGESVDFLGVNITNNLLCTHHIEVTAKRTHQRLYFLRRLRKFGKSLMTLTNFSRCAVESILLSCNKAWVWEIADVAQSITYCRPDSPPLTPPTQYIMGGCGLSLIHI